MTSPIRFESPDEFVFVSTASKNLTYGGAHLRLSIEYIYMDKFAVLAGATPKNLV